MRLSMSLLVPLACLVILSACASGGGREHASKGPGGGRSSGPAGGDLYSRAMTLKSTGRCEAAEKPLERLARQGGGFEIAQFHLGDCMLMRTSTVEGPQIELLISRSLYWLELAANSGEPKAQARLVEVHVNETLGTLDIVEAATWYLIFQKNSKRTFLEIVEIDPEAEATLHRLATEEDWATAKTKADGWSRVIQEVKVPDAGFPTSRTEKPSGRDRGGNRGGRRGRGGGKGQVISASSFSSHSIA